MRNLVTFRVAFYAFGAVFVLAFCASGAQPTTKSAGPSLSKAAPVSQATRGGDHGLLAVSETLPEDDPSARRDVAPSAGRRDPFKLPPPLDGSEGGMMLSSHRPPGVHGLLVSELTLDGIVSENSGHDMIAVVTNSTGRAYFLRENVQLFDGRLTKITPQAAYFVETIRDRKGHESVQQVVKWLNSKPGDAQ